MQGYVLAHDNHVTFQPAVSAFFWHVCEDNSTVKLHVATKSGPVAIHRSRYIYLIAFGSHQPWTASLFSLSLGPLLSIFLFNRLLAFYFPFRSHTVVVEMEQKHVFR